MFIESWWNALNLERQIFYGIGLLALLGLAIQLVLSLFGGIDDHEDFSGGDVDHSSGLGVFSIRGLTAFFLGFGWIGVIVLKAGYGLMAAIGCGLLVGAVLMVSLLLLFRSLLRFQSSGTLDYVNAIGQIATVYTTIPAGQKAGGQVELMLQGRLIMAEALNKSGQDLKPGTKVKVLEKISHATLVVEPLSS